MNSWQKRARIGIAIFGCAVAAVVFVALRPRETPAPPPALQRIDPKAMAEISGGTLERVVLSEKNFKVEYDNFRVYPDGSKFSGIRITVPKGENRTFVVSAREAAAGKDEVDLGLSGDVKLEDSDGFVLTTDRGTFNQKAMVASAPGAVAFGRGRMKGTGAAISYDQERDLLTIGRDAHVTTADEEGQPVMDFTAGSSALDRLRHVLMLDTAVHVVRGEQVIDTDHSVARLSDTDDVVTFVELRGNSRVQGGGSSIDAMVARDIDLDYTDDGTRLEAVKLVGTAAVAMKGENGSGQRQIVGETIDLQLGADGSIRMMLNGKASVITAAASGGSGRAIAADALEMDVAADGSLTRAVGRENVRLDLPAEPGAAVRSIRTKLLDGRGAAGKGLTSATFTGEVVYSEQAPKTAPRTVRAQKLEAAMAGDVINSGTFTGDVTFEETGLKACAGRLEYQPDKGTLALSGTTPAGLPTLAEEQINIEAETLEVELQQRRITSKGAVTTRMGAGTRCKPSTERPAAERGARKLPGLLDQDTAATIKAGSLDYEGAAGKAVYSGRALLTQGRTSIHSNTLTLDQEKGDLTATGDAVATMTLDGGDSTGRAHEIRYVDAMRLITYAAPPPGYVAPRAVPGVTVAREPQLSVPQGTISAGTRIDVRLAKEGATLQEIDARTNVSMRQTIGQGNRTATGGARLTYLAGMKQFEMVAARGGTLVTIVDRSSPSSCREYSGRSVIFFESGESIKIDGQDMNRTGMAPTACPAR